MRPAAMRILAVLLATSQLTGGTALAESAIQTLPEIRALFEQELFELAHTVFLANGNLKEALSVAQRAVKARPADKLWRKKLAQTAEWAGRPDLALEHWFYLAERGDREARQPALRLSRALQEFSLRMRLLELTLTELGGDPALLQEYLIVAEGMGLPQRAYDLLQSGTIRGGEQVWQLTEQARLAEHLGRPADAIRAWQRRSALKPLEVGEALKLAALWYGQGDTVQAWRALQQTSSTAPATATDFWRTYADLSWTLQKTDEAVQASELLIKQGTALDADFQRMLELNAQSNPERAYGYAVLGWKQLQKPFFWHAMADNGLRSGKARELSLFLKSLHAEERAVLARDARSWLSMAQVYRAVGSLHASLVAARVAVRLAPSEPDLLSAYLWLLVDMKQVTELRPLIRAWEGRIPQLPELREPLAAAMMLMGDTPRALRHYRVLAPQRQHDPAWLASFSDVLEQSGDAESAWKIRRRAYRLLHRQRQPEMTAEEARTMQLTRAQLLLHLAPGDKLTSHIRQIAVDRHDDFGRELVMGWAMATGQTDQARLWYWKNFARTVQRPEWARLGLALEENDRSLIAELLDTRLDQLPYRDAIEAAVRSGESPTAETHAFTRFELNKEDYLLDKQVRELYGARPGYLQGNLTLQDGQRVSWLQNRLTVAQPLTHRWSLRADLTEREFQLNDDVAQVVIPKRDVGGSLMLMRRHERGYLAVSLGMRDGGIANFAVASLEGQWQPFRDLTFMGQLEYHGRADEGEELSVAAVRDRMRVLTTVALTPKDTLSLDTAGARYHDQTGSYLGTGLSANLDLRHQFTRAWPDYGVRLFGGYHHFQADGVIAAELVRQAAVVAVPAGTTAPSSLIMPSTFGQAGLGVFLGQTWKTAYTRDWKPFAEADASWNSNSGYGFSYGLGVVGPVIGLDQLMFELTQGSGQFGVNDLNTTIGVTYRYFY